MKIKALIYYLRKQRSPEDLPRPVKLTIHILALVYYVLLFYLLFIGGRHPWQEQHVNLVLFKEKIEAFAAGYHGLNLYTDLFGNILAFIPFGFFLVFVFNTKSLNRIVFIAALTSFLVELTQFAFGVGVADIDDIVLNTTGTIIGLISMKPFFKAFPPFLPK